MLRPPGGNCLFASFEAPLKDRCVTTVRDCSFTPLAMRRLNFYVHLAISQTNRKIQYFFPTAWGTPAHL